MVMCCSVCVAGCVLSAVCGVVWWLVVNRRVSCVVCCLVCGVCCLLFAVCSVLVVVC